MAEFDANRREAFCALIEQGETIESACATVGVSRPTVTRWRRRGEHAPAGSEHAEFAERLAEAQETAQLVQCSAMDEAELHAHVAAAVRGGSVQAMKLMADLLRATRRPPRSSAADGFDALDADTIDLARERAKRIAERRHGA